MTERFETVFDVLMMSNQVRKHVANYVFNMGYSDVTYQDVEIIPTEKVRIVWRDSWGKMADRYELANGWKSNARLQGK